MIKAIMMCLLFVGCTSAPPKYRHGQHFMENNAFYGDCIGTIVSFSADRFMFKEFRDYGANIECRHGNLRQSSRPESEINPITDTEYESIRCDWERLRQPKRECK